MSGEENPVTPQQAIASLTSVAPFLWPFVLLSLGVALTPVSPISWSYSTWLLFIIPLTITVFAPIRTFSGPLRYAYLEYASKIASWAVSLLKAVITNFHSVPTLALPALFFLPVLPIFFFVFFPAIPIVWHYIAYHYRRRLKVITTSAAKTNASLDLATARAREAMDLAHTYEKQALYIISTTRSTPLLAVSRHSTDFGTPEFNNPQRHWRPTPSPGTLGADLAGKVLDTEKKMAVIENASQEVRALSEQAVTTATEGDMADGDKLIESAVQSLENVLKRVDELRSIAEQARGKCAELRRRLNKVTASASTTTAGLDLAMVRAREAMVLARTYEKEVLYTISTTRSTPSLTLSRHTTDFSMPEFDESEERWQLTESPDTLGADLAEKVLDTEKRMAAIEGASQKVRTSIEQALVTVTEGDMEAGEKSAANAENSLRHIETQVETLRSMADQTRLAWVDFRRRLNKVTTSASTTTASLDLAVARAREAMALARTYEKQVLYSVSTTRSTHSLALSRHTTDFSTPEFDDSEERWQLTESPDTLGADLAEKVLDTEKHMAAIELESQKVRTLLDQAFATATEGDMDEGEKLAKNAADSLEDIETQVDTLRSMADQARWACVDFRRRLTEVITSTSTTSASLDLAMARAGEAMALAHTYKKQALFTVTMTRSTPLLGLPRHGIDFSTTEFDDSEERWGSLQSPDTLGGDLAGRILDTEKEMTAIEEESRNLRILLAQAVATATQGDMEEGEKSAKNAADSLEDIETQVTTLHSTADQARCTWVDFRRRFTDVTTSASKTTASLELTVTQARRVATLAHTYEKQALAFVSTTRRSASQTLALHDADFFEASTPVQQAKRTISEDAKKVRELGNTLTDKMSLVEATIGDVESEAEKIRAILVEAVTAAADGDVAKGEDLTANAGNHLTTVIRKAQVLGSTSAEVRQNWVKLSVEYWTIP